MKNDHVILLAAGDIMVSSNRGTGAAIDKYGASFPFIKVQPVLAGADLRFANLESPISAHGRVSGKQDAHITFRASPEAAEGLAYAGFDIVSLANNHMNDYGDEALLDTLALLQDKGIDHVGAGRDEEEACRAVIVKRKGIRIGFLAYSAFANLDTRPACGDKSGIAWFIKRRAMQKIRHLRSEVDIVIVSLHWGLDFAEYPVPFQMKQARALVDAGAHLVLGHHSHLLQGTEQYRHGIIVYSLGDFVFDEEGRETCLLRVELSRSGIEKIDFIPARINDKFQPEPLSIVDGQKIRDRIAALSAAYTGYDSAAAQKMVDFYIRTNWQIFRGSGNRFALRNLLQIGIILRMITLFFMKVKKFYSGQSTDAAL